MEKKNLLTSMTGKDWNKHAKQLSSRTGNPNVAAIASLLEETNTRLPFARATGILDNGCGPGAIMSDLIDTYTLPEGCQLTCSDYSESMIDIIRTTQKQKTAAHDKVWPRVKTMVSDAMDMSMVESNSQSHVLAGWVYFMTPDPQKCLAESRRMLREDGILGLSSWKGSQWLDIMNELTVVFPGRSMPELPQEWSSIEGVKQEMVKAGFSNVVSKPLRVHMSYQSHEEIIRLLLYNIPVMVAATEGLTNEQLKLAETAMIKKCKEINPEEPGQLDGNAILAIGSKTYLTCQKDIVKPSEPSTTTPQHLIASMNQAPSSQARGRTKATGVVTSPMRASIIRIDSPVTRSPSGRESGQATARTPLAEVSSGIAMNGVSPQTTLLTDPRRLTMPPIVKSLRKVSSEKLETPTRQDAGENESPHWSAVGHATTSGKSGRVIERLMAENDRLKKDLELQLLRSQELEKNLQTMRPQLDALRAENSNLSHLKSVDGSLLSRRDRKIDTLKEELAQEKVRRQASEALLRQTLAEKDDVIENARRDVQQAQEEAKHSSVHATILEQSHRQLSTDYRTRATRWRKDIDDIETDRRIESQKLARLEVVAEQMRTELERSRKLHADFSEQFDQYRKATDRWRTELEQVVTNETSRSKALSDDMQTVVDKMRWVMSNHTAQLDDQGRRRNAKNDR